MRLPAALRFVPEPRHWMPERTPDSAPIEIARLRQAQEQPLRRQFCLLFRAEISSALSSFLLVIRGAPELAQRTMKCEGKVEPKGNAVKRGPTTGLEKVAAESRRRTTKYRNADVPYREARCFEIAR